MTTPSFDLFATGVGGVLYPPDILKISDENLDGIRNCICADDIYLKYLEDLYNVPVLWVKNGKVHGKRKIVENQKNALSKDNVLKKRNDEYIKIFLKNKKKPEVVKEEAKGSGVKFVPKEVPKPVKRQTEPPRKKIRRMPVNSLQFLKDSNRRIGLIRM